MECKPLKLTQMVAEKFPHCWEILEKIRNDESADWDKQRCYVPIRECMLLLDTSSIKSAYIGQIMAATASWRLHKQVYQFTPEMEEMLMKQNDNKDIIVPVDVFDNLPYQCIYIKLNQNDEYDGFFVHFDDNTTAKRLELRLLFLDKNNDWKALFLFIEKGKTLKDNIINILEENERIKRASHIKLSSSKEDLIQNYIDMIGPYLQLILYICAENKEIEENPKQKKITKKPKNKNFIKDKYREVQIWDLGLQTTEAIRKYNKSHSTFHHDTEDTDIHTTGNGTPKRPHSRRGHWHHYWTGAKGTQERKLVLKWVAPTFIHSGTKAVQINIVKE